jgi:ureidoacrylate peracid hydrolase
MEHDVHIDSRHSALLIIDIQNDFCHEDGARGKNVTHINKVQQVVPVIERLRQEAQLSQIPVFFVQTTHSAETSSEVWAKRSKRLEGRADLVQKGSWGAEFYKLIPNDNDIIIEKHRYSAFSNTTLHELLRKLNRKSLLIVGVATNVCVESTAREGFGLEYHITLIRDGCSAYNSELEQATFTNIESSFGRVMESDEVIRNWQHHRS